MASTFTIDGTEYTYEPLKTKVSLKLMTRITRAVGKPLGSLMNANGSAGAQVSALMDLFAAVDDETLEHCITTFGGTCTYTDKTGNYRLAQAFDTHFAGRQMSAIAWLAQCAGAEYGDFLAELNRLGAASLPQVQSA